MPPQRGQWIDNTSLLLALRNVDRSELSVWRVTLQSDNSTLHATPVTAIKAGRLSSDDLAIRDGIVARYGEIQFLA